MRTGSGQGRVSGRSCAPRQTFRQWLLRRPGSHARSFATDPPAPNPATRTAKPYRRYSRADRLFACGKGRPRHRPDLTPDRRPGECSAVLGTATDVARSVKRLCALEGIPVRRTLTMEALVILWPGLLTPAHIRIFLTLGRQHGYITAI